MKQHYDINNESKEKKIFTNIFKSNLKYKKLAKMKHNELKKSNINRIINIYKIRKNNIYQYINLLILYVILLMNYSFILSKYILKFSEVTLKINEKGNIKILSDSFFQTYNQCEIYINDVLQCEIYINDVLQNISTNEYNFSSFENNTVKIIWNIDLTSTESMFLNCSQISEINLSFYNSTKVTSMKSMFYGCSSLTTLNLYNFETSQVIDMEELFYNCNSLISG